MIRAAFILYHYIVWLAVNVAFFEWKKLENRPFMKAQISKMEGKTMLWHSRWRMFLCSSSSAVGLWLSRLKEGKQSNYFYTVLSLLSSSAKVGQISETWSSKFSCTATFTVFGFKAECDVACFYRVSVVLICVRMASHCSLLCQVRPVCPGGWSSLLLLSWTNLSRSGAQGRLLSFRASVSFLFTLLAKAPEHTPKSTWSREWSGRNQRKFERIILLSGGSSSSSSSELSSL